MVNIKKSPNDDREYRYLKLDNGISVVLVHDAQEQRSAASLAVAVGSTSNPENYEGLAHFLEHMLFLGTKKYPVEKEFSSFIEQSGGVYNAETHASQTRYYFSVFEQHLDQALDRFASFFISPLLTEDATQREINAVDSEYQGSVQNESWRRQFVNLLSFDDHPVSRFGCGSLETLQKPDLHAKMVEFYKKYYSANLMNLVVLGPQSLDRLEALARQHFSSIENHSVEVPKFGGFNVTRPLKGLVVPVKDANSVTITWPLPMHLNATHTYKKKMVYYLSNVLGHEARGSLLSYLQSLGYVYTLVSGEVPHTEDAEYFFVEMKLTDKGVENIDTIIGHVNNYIELMKRENATHIFDEVKQQLENGWESMGKLEIITYVSDISGKMCETDIDVSDLLAWRFVIGEFDNDLYHELLNTLRLDKASVYVFSKAFEKEANLIHKYYAFQYSTSEIGSETLAKWRAVPVARELYLPIANPYMPENFDIRAEQNQAVDPLQVVYNEGGITVHYTPDHQFNVPLAQLNLQFKSSLSTAREFAMVYLLKKCIKPLLNEDILYYTVLAGARLKFRIRLSRVEYSIISYNHKLIPMVLNILTKLASFELSEFQFQLALSRALEKLKNLNFASPIDYALQVARAYLLTPHFEPAEHIAILESLDYHEFVQFVRRYIQTINIECIASGNITRDEVVDMSRKLPAAIRNSSKPTAACDIVEVRRVMFEQGKRYHIRSVTNDPDQVNSVCVAFFQVGKNSVEQSALAILYNRFVSTLFFDELRTKQQLCYIIRTAVDITLGTIQLRVQIQSNSKDPEYLFDRIDEYIANGLKKELENIDQDTFNKYVQTVQELMLDKKHNLFTQMIEYIDIFQVFDGNQDIRKQQVEYLSKVQKSDLLNFFEQFVFNKEKRRMLVVQIYGAECQIKPMNDPVAFEISNPTEFKASMGTYSPFPTKYLKR